MKISTSLKLLAVVFLSGLSFTQATAQAGGSCAAKWNSQVSNCSVHFTNASSGTSSSTTYAWNFGDGQTSNVPNPSHTYTASGTYTVCLTIADNGLGNICQDVLCKPVTVDCGNGSACTAYWQSQADPSNPCMINFTDASTGTGSSTAYSWDFGNGQTSTSQNPAHTYTASGSYSVCLTIITQIPNGSCTDTYCQVISVQCGTGTSCTANWSSQTGSSSGCTINFTDLSAGASAWTWDFGDGNTALTQNPSHTYTASGTYTVCLTITVLVGGAPPCRDSLCKNIIVQCPPTGIASHEASDFWLKVNNPVVYSADVTYYLPANGQTELALFDILGNKVRVLETGNKNTGMHSAHLTSADFSKGIYFINLNFEGSTINKKIIIAE